MGSCNCKCPLGGHLEGLRASRLAFAGFSRPIEVRLVLRRIVFGGSARMVNSLLLLGERDLVKPLIKRPRSGLTFTTSWQPAPSPALKYIRKFPRSRPSRLSPQLNCSQRLLVRLEYSFQVVQSTLLPSNLPSNTSTCLHTLSQSTPSQLQSPKPPKFKSS